MEKVKITKIDSFSIFKTSISICSIIGLIIGIIIGLTSVPIKTTTSLNGEIIQRELLANFWTSMFGAVFGTMFYFITIAIVISLISIAFNFFSKVSGGITIEIEKERELNDL